MNSEPWPYALTETPDERKCRRRLEDATRNWNAWELLSATQFGLLQVYLEVTGE